MDLPRSSFVFDTCRRIRTTHKLDDKMTDLAAEAPGPEQGKAALRQGWHDFAVAHVNKRSPAKKSA